MKHQRQPDAEDDNKMAALSVVPVTITVQMAASWMKGFSEIQSEMTRFVLERLRQDIDLHKQMLACRSPKDVQDLQSGFMHHAAEEYFVELSKLFGMGSRWTDRTAHGGDALTSTKKDS